MQVHDSVKSEVLNLLRKYTDLVEPEFYVGRKRIDLAFRNLRFIAEVEPNEVKKETEGKPQLEEYAKIVLEKTGYKSVVGALIWAKDKDGREWDVEIYEYSKEGVKTLGRGRDTLTRVIASIPKNKLPLTTFNFSLLFSPIKEAFYKRIRRLLEKYEKEESVKPLIEAYKNALELVYGGGKGLEEEKIKELFTLHTLIQIIANAVLSYVLLGRIDRVESLTGKYKPYSVSLPFLEWLYELYEKGILEEKEVLEELLNELRRKIIAFDWGKKSQDIFRLLYEEFISEEDRRVFGEYYTPLWLVRFMLSEAGSLKGKLVLDPFCGSGTFLDEALRRKVQEGEKVQDAINSVIGFDVNPVAVMLARAELLLTYRNLSNDKSYPTPLVFYVNSAEVFSETQRVGKLFTQGDKKKPVFLYHVKELTEVFNPSKLQSSSLDFNTLREFEGALKYILEEVYRDLRKGKEARGKLIKLMNEFSNGDLKPYFTALKPDKLYQLLEKYGDGVWAVSLASLFAVHILKNRKVDICVSNPPWIHLTEVRGEYGELLRSLAKKLLKKGDPSKAVQGGNIASVFLKGFNDIAEVVFFVLPDSVVSEGGVHGIGKLLTFRAIEGKPYRIYRVLYDAFGHGEKPALVLTGKGNGEILNVKPEGRPQKDTREERLTLERHEETYRKHIEKLLLYFQEDITSLARHLNVERIYKQGSFIRGLFGGEKKRGKELYAGLVIEEISEGLPLRIRLVNTESFAEVYETRYIKEVVYRGFVYPFYAKPVKCILSDRGERDLKEFLKKLSERVAPKDRERILKLAEEVKQGSLLKLNPEKWYVIYRSNRSFVGFAICGSETLTFESHLSCMETIYPEIAFYYASALNYLAYKVVEKGKSFIRDQFARPLLAIKFAGIEWRGERWQYEVSRLSSILHEKAEELYRDVNTKRVKAYLKVLEDEKEWKEILELFNKKANNLGEALEFVSE
ncbi:MAG: hypothetical protein DSY32_03995 [Aquifex sp.]|nr:MAG: hypothetical protein DSY32_03995 [Aquifex sp.]